MWSAPKNVLLMLVLATSFPSLAQQISTITIEGAKYTGILDSTGFRLVDANKHRILRMPIWYFSFEFRDLNNDGFKDIFLNSGGNTPEVFDLLLYVPATKHFIKIKNFNQFPSPKRVSGTIYYYSYHKSGCADMYWDSDLFYIRNFKAIRVGNIMGNECDTPKGAFIYKVRDNKRFLFKKLPLDTLYNYEDIKWGFIRSYWTRHSGLF